MEKQEQFQLDSRKNFLLARGLTHGLYMILERALGIKTALAHDYCGTLGQYLNLSFPWLTYLYNGGYNFYPS